jgi:plastocyanin
MTPTTHLKRLLALAAIVLLAAACGGGGGGDEGAPAPAPAEAAGGASGAPAAGDTAANSLGSASISGTVRYDGDVPNLRPVSMGADPGCAAKHAGPVASEVLVLGDGNSLGNVMVTVSGGLPEGGWPVPGEPAVLDQDGCRYKPHVLGLMAGQPLRILNSDGLLHNVHALPKVNKQFNLAMPGTVTESMQSFDKVEDTFEIKCDVHPWMKSYVRVLDHPFYAVTGADGGFSLDGLPAGTYELEAWHERLGTRSGTATVDEGGNATVDFTFSAP